MHNQRLRKIEGCMKHQIFYYFDKYFDQMSTSTIKQCLCLHRSYKAEFSLFLLSPTNVVFELNQHLRNWHQFDASIGNRLKSQHIFFPIFALCTSFVFQKLKQPKIEKIEYVKLVEQIFFSLCLDKDQNLKKRTTVNIIHNSKSI